MSYSRSRPRILTDTWSVHHFWASESPETNWPLRRYRLVAPTTIWGRSMHTELSYTKVATVQKSQNSLDRQQVYSYTLEGERCTTVDQVYFLFCFVFCLHFFRHPVFKQMTSGQTQVTNFHRPPQKSEEEPARPGVCDETTTNTSTILFWN